MTPERAALFMEHARSRFIADLVKAGETPSAATRAARTIEEREFPDGPLAAGHLLFDIVVDDAVSGHLWLAPPHDDDAATWFVWDIEVEAAVRGNGVGRAIMQAVEHEVRGRGGREIGLSVFGWNSVAWRLYETLGYEVVTLRMRKAI